MTRVPEPLIEEILRTARTPEEAHAMFERVLERLVGIEEWAANRPLPTEPAAPRDETKSWQEVLADAPPPPPAADRRAWWAERSLPDNEGAVHGHRTAPAQAVRLAAHWHHLNAGHHEGDRHDETCEWCARGEFGVQSPAREQWRAA
jgi:hypothetical protein